MFRIPTFAAAALAAFAIAIGLGLALLPLDNPAQAIHSSTQDEQKFHFIIKTLLDNGEANAGDIATLQLAVDDLLNLSEAKTIFVTSTTYTGDLGGLAGADIICQGLADAPGSIVPVGEYIALLSTEDVTSSTRFGPTTGPFIRPDGVLVAAGYAELFGAISTTTARDLINSVSIDEQGEENTNFTWTTTSASGTPELDILGPMSACSGWTSEDSFARVGISSVRDDGWLNFQNKDCDTMNAFYCVQL